MEASNVSMKVAKFSNTKTRKKCETVVITVEAWEKINQFSETQLNNRI